MPYYLLKIYYRLSNWFWLFGAPTVFSCFFDLSENEVRGIKDAKERNQSLFVKQTQLEPKNVVSVTVYRTEKSTLEYSAPSDMQQSEVERNIIDGKIGKNVTKSFFPLSIIHEERHSTIEDLVMAAEFLGLDENWFVATCALQLQEAMIARLAEKHKISLDKENIKRILNKKEVKISSDFVPFGEKYRAFSKEASRLWDIQMPKLTLEFRNSRNDVLHNGYNPTREESSFFADYTADSLKRLDASFKAEKRPVSD